MAKYIRVPKDMNEIREKFILNLTKRQAICFAIGAGCGIPVYFLVKGLGITLAVFLMGFAAAPAIIFGLFEKNGLHMEDYFKLMLNFWRTDKIRAYQTESVYREIENRIEYKRLVKRLKDGGKKVGK